MAAARRPDPALPACPGGVIPGASISVALLERREQRLPRHWPPSAGRATRNVLDLGRLGFDGKPTLDLVQPFRPSGESVMALLASAAASLMRRTRFSASLLDKG